MTEQQSSSPAARIQQRAAASAAAAAAAGGRGSQCGGAGGAELHEPQFPPQHLVLFAAPRDLQLQHRVPAVHQLADLRHRRVGQHLHDGGQLRVEASGGRHVVRAGSEDRGREPDRDVAAAAAAAGLSEPLHQAP